MLRVIGLMSGTSLDGVDAAWVETDGERVGRLGPRLTLPYDDALRRDLRAILDDAPRLAPGDARVEAASRALTERHAEAVTALGEPADLIGFHGQTILHRPAERRTWQIGDAALLARATGVPVAHDFRSADVAAGGQGAPLAPAIHAALARDLPDRPLSVLNLGGVGNVTWIGEGAGDLLAFDTGPANGPLDDLARARRGLPRDEGGAMALAGRADATVLARLTAHSYLAAPPPKSLDRLDFGAAIAGSGLDTLGDEDAAATLVAFAAACVAAAARHLPSSPSRWLVAGGGRHNAAMMRALAETLAPAPVEPAEAVGWDGDALEAQAFALLAARVVRGLPITFPGTTGVANPMGGGRVFRPW